MAAADNLTTEERCGYCYEDFTSKTDRRELPCQHTFCLPCLRGDSRMNGGVSCPICETVYESLNIEKLPRINATVDYTIEPESSTCDRKGCDACAISYCVECGDKLCDTHQQAHHAYLGEEHKVISVEEYKLTRDTLKPPLCQDHSLALGRACFLCDKLVCIECDIFTKDCLMGQVNVVFDDHSDSECEDGKHDFRTFPELSQLLSSRYTKVQKSIGKKLTKICKQQKEIWSHVDREEVACAQMLVDIDKKQDIHIKSIMEQYEKLKQEVNGWKEELTGQVEQQHVRLMEKKEELEGLRARVHRVAQKGHITDQIKQRRGFEAAMADFMHSSEKAGRMALLIRDLKLSLDTSLVKVPSSLTLLSAHWIGDSCFAACFRNSSEILVGTEKKGMKLFNWVEDTWVHCYPTNSDHVKPAITSISTYNRLGYIVQLVTDVCFVDVCLPDITKKHRLFQFERSSASISRLSVCGRLVATTNPDTHEVYMYDLVSEQTTKVGINAIDVKLLPDGHLLTVANEGSLVKFNVTENEATIDWDCYGLDGASRVCVGDDGLIYVSAMKKKAIYIVSPQGEKLDTLKSTDFPKIAGSISVSGDNLILSGWTDCTLYLFKLNR